jgi:hypothetical protein
VLHCKCNLNQTAHFDIPKILQTNNQKKLTVDSLNPSRSTSRKITHVDWYGFVRSRRVEIVEVFRVGIVEHNKPPQKGEKTKPRMDAKQFRKEFSRKAHVVLARKIFGRVLLVFEHCLTNRVCGYILLLMPTLTSVLNNPALRKIEHPCDWA